MNGRCRSTLAPLPDRGEDGYSTAALRRLTGSRRQLPVRVEFTRADVLRERGERAQRISISGLQDKVSVRLRRGRLSITEEGGEFILKPVPGTPLPRLRDQVPANEHVTMQIAEQIFGIDSAACALIEMADGEPAYVTRRFDRDTRGVKRSMEDFCSLAGRSPATHGRNFKYEGSYERIGRLIRRHCPAHRVELEKLLRRICFDYLTGNGDAHLKNFSVIASPDGDPVLTPAYDLLSTTLHLPDESPLALDLFEGDFMTPAFERHGFPTAADFVELSDRFGIAPRRRDRILAASVDEARFGALIDLVRRSFLAPEAQDAYLEISTARRRALSIGLDWL